jgi:hypothetical protein
MTLVLGRCDGQNTPRPTRIRSHLVIILFFQENSEPRSRRAGEPVNAHLDPGAAPMNPRVGSGEKG